MKTIKKATITPIYVQYIPRHHEMEEGKIYISKEFETATHLCLCGCGFPTVTPLKYNGWELTDKEGKITITPSIGNFQYPCKSHYIITNGVANFV